MVVLRSLGFNIAFFAVSVVCAAAFTVGLLLPPPAMLRMAAVWGRVTEALLARIVGLKVTVRGRENLIAGAAIIASKHQSAWETIMFPRLFRRPVFVVKQELLQVPLYGPCLAHTGAIGVDRQGGARALRALLAQARRVLAEGHQVLIFPEGTRVAPGSQVPFHPGVAALYSQLGVPVIPVALNSGVFWGRRSFLKRPGEIVVEILPPIPPGIERRRFQRLLEERIEAASTRLMTEAGWRPPVDNPVDKPSNAATTGERAGTTFAWRRTKEEH